MKISSTEEHLSANKEDSYILAIEFPDEDLKAYVKSDSTLFPNSLLEFQSKESASDYAKQYFPGMHYFVEKK